jgi:hypothetical protein
MSHADQATADAAVKKSNEYLKVIMSKLHNDKKKD